MNSNRRSFLFGSAVTAGAALSQSAQAQVAAKVPTAVIGTGNRGSYLLRGVLEQQNTKVVALCDIKPDRLDKAASAAAKDNPRTYSDWRQIIDRNDVEAVFIATPPDLHSDMAIAALQAGKHVYCEKPIGITPEQVRRLVSAAKASNKVFTAGQQLRSTGQLAEAVGKIHDGIIGKVAMVKAQRHANRDLSYDGSSGDWYYNVVKSGGYLVEQSVHNLDLCNWVINEHPSSASGYGGMLVHPNEPPNRSIFDCGVLAYDYPSGVTMSFTQNVFHPRGMPGAGQYVQVFGTTGAVDLMGTTNLYSLEGNNEQPTVLAARRQDPPHAHITAFYDCITKGGKNPADIVIGATAALTAVMGHMAMASERTVTWDELDVSL